MNLLYPTWLLFLILHAFSCTSSGQAKPPAPQVVQNTPSLSQLKRSIRQERAITVVYGSQEPQLAKAYADLLAPIPGRSRWLTVDIKSDEEVSELELKEKIIFLIGSPKSNKIVAQLLKHFPLELNAQHLEFAGQTFSPARTL
ncbi:MAG: hypothetical protein AAGD05_16000, partial [Bacteroidota bacterium]